MKVKTTCTLYFDWDNDCICIDKPNGRYGEDYSVIRRGTVFEVYEDNNVALDLGVDEKYKIICFNKKGNWLGFENLKEFYKCNYLAVKES